MTPAAGSNEAIELPVGSRTVRITNPERVYFSARGETKLDLVNYYLGVGDGIVRVPPRTPVAVGDRVRLRLSGDRVHFFDPPSGKAIRSEAVTSTS